MHSLLPKDNLFKNIFHQGLHSLLRQKCSSENKKLQSYLEIVSFDPLNYTMYHSKFIASIKKEQFIIALRVLQQQRLELHVYDETPNLVNFVVMSLTELNLQQTMQVSC